MEQQGWIKLHRKLVDWEWYKDANTSRLFIHLLIHSNHKPAKWQGHTIGKGQKITSLEILGFELGLSVMQIRTAIKKLKLTREITCISTSKYTLITVLNYDSYQEGNTPDNKPITNEQQTDNKPITTNNNEKNKKNDENEKKVEASPTLESIQLSDISLWLSSKNFTFDLEAEIEAFKIHYRMTGGKMNNGRLVSDWRATLQKWFNNAQKYKGQTYENTGRNTGINGGHSQGQSPARVGKSALAEQVDRVKAKILGDDLHPSETASNPSGKQRSEIEGTDTSRVLLDDVKFIRQENR